jgi:hypothetical protein
LAGRRKPELLDTVTYSLTNYREAETVVAEFDSLRARAERVGKMISADAQDAYYQLVRHPVDALANLTRLYVTVARNRQYAQQGRAMTNALADSARHLFERDAEISRYYNTELAGGKWSHMMDQTHIGYTYWQEPPRNTMPRVDVIQLPLRADMGVAIVEANRPAPPGRGGPFGGGAAPFGAPREAALPPFDPYSRQTYHVDVYNRGATPFEFSAQTAEPWLIISPSRGTIDKQQRVAISVDWSRAPIGERRVGVTFTGPNESRSVVQAVINNPAAPNRDSVVGFVEGAGFISMEAEHYTNAVRSRAVGWQRIPDFGRTLSGMTMTPVTSAAQTPGGSAPRLDYQVFLFDSGAVKVRAFFSPTFNFTAA